MSGALARMLVTVLIACSARGTRTSTTPARPGVEITLYRDRALVAHRLAAVVPPAAPAKLRLRLAAGVDPDELFLVEPGPLKLERIEVLGTARTPSSAATADCDEMACILDGERPCCARYERAEHNEARAPVAGAPVDVEVTLLGPHEGTFPVVLGYATPRLDWEAAYTLMVSGTRARGELQGSLAIRNATGLAFPEAAIAVADREYEARTAETREGADPPVAEPRQIARLDLVEGDSRVELISRSVALYPLLVFDPVGPGLDYQHGQPVQERNLGINPPPSTTLLEALAFDRTPALRDLPGGVVRAFERTPRGALALISEAKLYGADTRTARVDTIPLRAAERVTGKRERRELTVDNDRKRIVEEFALTIDNTRPAPIDVLLREHLYRGQGWTIAYRSVFQIDKEGVQQVAMRAVVPARAKQTVLYVVVYEWDQPGPVKQ